VPKRVHNTTGIAPYTRTDNHGNTTFKGFRARYRGPDGRERNKVFAKRSDAVAWRNTQLADKVRGDWIDPQGARITVGALHDDWATTKTTLKESTKADYREIWRNLVKPHWETTPIGSITPTTVTKWVGELTQDGQSPSRTRKALLVLRQLLQIAVQNKHLPHNPVTEVRKPQLPNPTPKPLTREQFTTLLNNITHQGDNRALAEALVLTGMRIGEACALQVQDVDLTPGKTRIHIRRGVTVIAGETNQNRARQIVEDTPKGKTTRTVPLTPRGEQLFRQQTEGKQPGDLVFTNRAGGQIYARPFRSVIARAAHKAGLPDVAPHDLRDTYASWAIQSGANIKMLQAALGHKSATLTLDTYSTLMPDDMDGFRDNLAATEATLTPNGSNGTHDTPGKKNAGRKNPAKKTTAASRRRKRPR